MLTPSDPGARHEANHSAGATGSIERGTVLPSGEQARHVATSLVLLGVMLLFFAALLAAERHELHVLREGSQTVAMTIGMDTSLEALAVQQDATLAFGRAVLIAGAGVAVAALALLLRRAGWWFTVTVLALACLVTSARLFTVARAQAQAQTQSLGGAAPR